MLFEKGHLFSSRDSEGASELTEACEFALAAYNSWSARIHRV